MPTFNTIATELIEHAEKAYSHFSNLGYTIKVEPYEICYPFRPAMVCKRDHTQLAVIVSGRVDIRSIKDWVSMAKSTPSDFQVVICLPAQHSQKQLTSHQLELQQLGVGILVSNGGAVTQLSAPVDQNIRLSLPELAGQTMAVRRVLGPAYEHFHGGRWREGFEAACKAFEQEVLPYFKKAIDSGRLTAHDENGRPRTISAKRLSRLTLGQLAEEFGNARPLNGTDSLIHNALKAINPDRVNSTHKNKKAATEKRLRKNVGLHIHGIVQAVRALKS
jgi:hypothetical protein